MSSSNILELAIIAFIVVGIGAAIWRGGANNPVGTRRLEREQAAMASQLREVGGKVSEMEEKVEDLDKRAASKTDIKRLERQLASHSEKTDSIASDVTEIRETAANRTARIDAIGKQVDMIYQAIVEKGMK